MRTLSVDLKLFTGKGLTTVDVGPGRTTRSYQGPRCLGGGTRERRVYWEDRDVPGRCEEGVKNRNIKQKKKFGEGPGGVYVEFL